MSATEPARSEPCVMLEFGGDDNNDFNVSLATVFRTVADWLDENEDVFIRDVTVNRADEFDTWWVALYVDSVREELRVTDKWKQEKAAARASMEADRRELEAEWAARQTP
jgi:hypothetical protein